MTLLRCDAKDKEKLGLVAKTDSRSFPAIAHISGKAISPN
jgi:hypothetical protein